MKTKIFLKIACLIDILCSTYAYTKGDLNGIVVSGLFAVVMAVLSLEDY